MKDFFSNAADVIASANGRVNNFVWGPIMLVFFLLVGCLFTFGTRIFQISHIKYWLDVTFLNIFRKKEVRKTKDKHAISQFQSLCTALAATIGTGNIAGVATAIAAGGPGAVFWMWLSAFLGTMTNFAENTLGIKYRSKNAKGEWVGGAMYYMERGIKWKKFGKVLAVVFSCFCALASFGIGNMSQVNSIASGLQNSFHVDPRITAVILMIFVALVILGGIKRIASVAEKIVPFMAIAYILGGLVVICFHITAVPQAFALIFEEAFNFKAMGGGVLGYGLALAMRKGISRGVFSNEAGLGSSVMVHSASDVKEPVVQGMWGIFEVFADTLVVCTITALLILTSGVYDMSTYAQYAGQTLPSTLASGAALTSNAFASVIPHGDKFVAVAIMLFAFSTVLGWSFYGERAIGYLFGDKAVPVYKIFFICIIYFGCTASLDLVWDISDTFNGLMAIPNLIAVTLLSKEVFTMTKDYIRRVKEGKETEAGESVD